MLNRISILTLILLCSVVSSAQSQNNDKYAWMRQRPLNDSLANLYREIMLKHMYQWVYLDSIEIEYTRLTGKNLEYKPVDASVSLTIHDKEHWDDTTDTWVFKPEEPYDVRVSYFVVPPCYVAVDTIVCPQKSFWAVTKDYEVYQNGREVAIGSVKLPIITNEQRRDAFRIMNEETDPWFYYLLEVAAERGRSIELNADKYRRYLKRDVLQIEGEDEFVLVFL